MRVIEQQGGFGLDHLNVTERDDPGSPGPGMSRMLRIAVISSALMRIPTP